MKILITCHANADFDALSAMIGIRLLYDNSFILYPGSQEENTRNVFASIDKIKYGFIDAKDIDWNSFDKLVIVDTCQRNRLKHIEPILNRDNIDIVIWDHHHPSAEDITRGEKHIAKVGAVSSLICQELQKREIKISAEEATLIGLGIYGDTGFFTYSSTTEEDFLAASWLLQQGMNVTQISDMGKTELTGIQINALNDMLESARTFMINDRTIVIAETSFAEYFNDFSSIAQKFMEMKKVDALFAIGIMGGQIQVVARSRNNAINVGAICEELGGGGHVYAASASVKSKMIAEVRSTILHSLFALSEPEKTARDYMSHPVIGVDANTSMQKADELMLHFGLKAVPVFLSGTHECVGILDAQTAARGNAHGLGAEPVNEYMRRNIFMLSPDASLKDLVRVIVNERQRLAPIIENNEVIGVVTRTDIINVFANEFNEISLEDVNDKRKDVQKLIRVRLSTETQKILKLAGDLGAKIGMPVYAVGGFVRDLLLNHQNQDIDLVAEGDGISLARALATELCGRVREHEKFLTSVVIYHDSLGNERRIDVATARQEYYEYPAALPIVEISSIKMDLFRRDFSINALAIRLDSDYYGQLIDFFGGQRDIRDKTIKALHTLSFVEDPTRCIRAVRFEQRYKFKIGASTEKLIKNILPKKLIDKLSPHRLFHEFKLLCEEENGADCIIRLDEIGILKAMGINIPFNSDKIALLKRMKNILNWYRMLFYEEHISEWICYFLTLSSSLNYKQTSQVYNCLCLPEIKKAEVMNQREQMRQRLPALIDWQKNYDMGIARVSQIYELLQYVSLEYLLYTMAILKNHELKKNISLYITQWRREKPDINGNDLIKLGIKPGPNFSKLLKFTLMAKLDGKAPNAKTQLNFVKSQLKGNEINYQSD